jgi:tRNA(fMet)-specific endonuclease VapC
MKYLLDTNICIFYLRGKFEINKKIEEVEIQNCYISEITIAELIYGAKNSANYQKHIKEIDKIKQLFEVIPIKEVFEYFAEEKVRLKKKGIMIPDFDLLIGTTSLSRNLKMVTNNEKHLTRIKGIKIENWTKQEFNTHIKK